MSSKRKQGRPFARIAAALLAVICVLHAIRAFKALPITVGPMTIPVWMSIVAAIFTGLLAVMVWREAK